MRLADAGLPNDVSQPLRALAADYLEKAQALERAADQQQQQQQQVQPKKPDDNE